MITVRHAYLSDIDWLFDECKQFAGAYPSKYNLSENEAYGRQFLEAIIKDHLVLIGMKDGVRQGFIAGLVQPHHFNPNIKQLAELFWWVPEKYRMTGVGARLFLEFVAFGKSNCDVITMTMEKDTPISDAALEKRGFKLTEKAYLLECN